MKKLTNNSYKHYLCLCIISTIGFAANAQKLPNVQQQSLRTPVNVKVDGKHAERGQLQAYNNATNLFYTIANDDDNLYLTVRVKDQDAINKLMGGLALSIQHTKKENDKNIITVTYPVADKVLFFNLRGRKGETPDTTLKAADSVMMHYNKLLGESCKSIKVTGVKNLDTLISVYNDEGIKAAGLFNNKKVYTCEIAISLKHLGLSTTNPQIFFYHISLNGSNVMK